MERRVPRTAFGRILSASAKGPFHRDRAMLSMDETANLVDDHSQELEVAERGAEEQAR